MLSGSLQVRLICEYCDKGSLRDALDLGAFKLPDGGVNYPAVLDTAVEIVTAVLHLHQRNVLHSDLKVGAASNALSLECGLLCLMFLALLHQPTSQLGALAGILWACIAVVVGYVALGPRHITTYHVVAAAGAQHHAEEQRQ
jgi:hypothetical protein